eukprot:2811869-Prymnesium_polylepis.1
MQRIGRVGLELSRRQTKCCFPPAAGRSASPRPAWLESLLAKGWCSRCRLAARCVGSRSGPDFCAASRCRVRRKSANSC